MSIRGSFEIFSLPELFQIIDLGSKSGRLIVQVLAPLKTQELNGPYYIWFDRGRLVAVTNRFNQKGLIEVIDDRGWLSQLITQKLERLCPAKMPLGSYLNKMKLLKAQQIDLLFQIQLHQVYKLFSLSSGWFRFDEISTNSNSMETIAMPYLEMTGKSMNALEVMLHALRVLPRWEHYSEQLPEPSSTLEQLMPQPNLQLSLLEWQIWKLADRKNSLKTIAQELQESLTQIQKAAFRLIVTGLVEEIAQSSYESSFFSSSLNVAVNNSVELNDRQQQVTPQPSFSDSFLPNLLKFLRSFF
jgi:predicted DNA-binding ribbon-helix-helix protein